MNNNSNISQEQLERIERYINGSMSSEELKSFESELNNNPDFRIQVEDIKTLLLGIETQSLREQLDAFHEDVQPSSIDIENSPKVRYLQIRKLIAAAVVVIALGSFWFLNQNPNQKLYAKYFTPDPGLPTTMSNSTNFEFYDAMVNYKKGEYKLAIEKWESISQKNDTLNYFIGVAYLANKNEKDAIKFLSKSIENEKFSLVNDAYYYLGLAHLKSGNTNLAKKHLQNSTADKSQELLAELED